MEHYKKIGLIEDVEGVEMKRLMAVMIAALMAVRRHQGQN